MEERKVGEKLSIEFNKAKKILRLFLITFNIKEKQIINTLHTIDKLDILYYYIHNNI